MDSTDTLTKFGNSFQTKAISALSTDKEFLRQSLDIIDPKYFESESGKWIVNTIIDYFKEYKTLPTLEVFKIEVKKIDNEILKVSVVEALKNVFVHQSDQDLEYVKKVFLEFCKNQQIKNAIIKSVDMLERGDYDTIKTLVDKALRAGSERNVGHNYKEDIEDRMLHQARNVIPTPWTCINEITDGGLGPGELGVIVSPSGVGKSWLLTAIGSHPLKIGRNVLHYTFELNQNYVGLRYDTIFAGIEPNKIRHNVEKVRAIVDAMKGELRIKYFPTRSTNSHGLEAHLHTLEMLDFRPDIVIVDYADLMSGNGRSEARYMELGYIYEELRGLAGEFGFPIWTASQSQRCLDLSTEVTTSEGKQFIGNLKVGDCVETHLGFNKVIKIYPIEKQPVYEIKLKSGKKIICSANHEFPIENKKLLSISSGLKIGDKLLTKK